MPASIWFVPLFILIFAALIAATVAMRRHQLALRRQREALQKQRAAAHIREIALAGHAHTGRADIAVMLLQLACEMMEEAVQLAPQEASIGDALGNLRALIDSLHIDDRPPVPVPNPESHAELTRASMQLTEAGRLLSRLEARAEFDGAELRAMQNELRRVQRSLDFRMRMRRELEAPSTPLSTDIEMDMDMDMDMEIEVLPADPRELPVRISPSSH